VKLDPARVAALAALAASGCANLLGLDSTKLDFKDAMTDAPSACDGAPACTSTTGRSVCGQLLEVGANGGLPLRGAAPTGMACAGSSLGPCAFTVYGQDEISFFASTTTGRVTGSIDDCGRFVVPDLDATQANVAVVFAASGFETSASLVLGRPTMPGTDTVVAYGVDMASVTAWGTQLSSATPPDTTAGYLVAHVDSAGAPVATDKDRLNGADLPGPPTAPWVAYFTGSTAFGALDPTATATGPSGTSLVVPAAGTVTLSSARTGKTCTPMPMLQIIPMTLIYVALSC